MKKVKCNVARLTISGLFTQCTSAKNNLTDNPLFPNPSPPPAALSSKLSEATQAVALATYGSRQDKLKAQELVNELRELLRKIILYVNHIASGSEALILAAGFHVSNDKHMSQELPDAPGVSAIYTNLEGQILLKWVKPKRAQAFNIYVSDNLAGDFKLLQNSIGSQVMLRNLESCKRYYFKIQAVNRVGAGQFSNVVTQIAA